MSICQWILPYFRSQLSTKNIIHRFILSAYNYYIHRKKEMIVVNNSNLNQNQMLNSKLMDLLSTIDKSKIEQVSRMVENMSSDDLSNLVGMLSKSQKKK